MPSSSFSFARASALLAFAPALAAAQSPLPRTHAPRPTTAAITAADLMTRLYIFADDSMMGRETGTRGHLMSTAYIATELARLGLVPMGDSGGYFQNVPMSRLSFDPASTITVNGATLRGGVDFIATPSRANVAISSVPVIFGGRAGDSTVTLDAVQVRGKLVILLAGERRVPGGGRGRGAPRFPGAAAVATVGDLAPRAVDAVVHPREGQVTMDGPGAPAAGAGTALTVTAATAEKMLGARLDSARVGQSGATVDLALRFASAPAPARNVVAMLRGSDPALRGEYVALGAHNDHIGYLGAPPQDHDSLHAYRRAKFAIDGLVRRGQQPTAEQTAAVGAIHIDYDSLHRAHPARLDSIRNGADDDGSGSVTLLEIAEAFARAPVKPKRSLLFVWHTGEEKGLLGSRWATDHLPVPADSIVAQLNMDMVGRGAAGDIPGGGDRYLQLVGSRRLSTELGDVVESVNRTEPMPFTFDYQYDANGDPENIYCRSDHYNYARVGIPVVFFTTGLHGDYHQVTDEPQYIDYPHMARVGQLVHDVAMRVANAAHRPVVDKPKLDPNARCVQ